MGLTAGAFGPITGTPATPQFARVAIIGHTTEANGSIKQMVNVMDFRALSPAPGGSAATLAANIAGILQGPYLNVCSDTYLMDNFTVKFMDNPLSIPGVNAVGAAGTITTDRSASFTSAVIRKVSGVPSRNYRGSMHIGALPESFTTTDHLNTTGTTAYDLLVAEFTGLVASGVSDGVNAFFPIVLSPTLSNLLVNPSIFFGAAVMEYVLNARIGTMKRRKEKSAA